MNTVAILQARMGSTRLPGKVLLPLADKPMLQNIIERVQRSTSLSRIVVTCPLADAEIFAPIVEICRYRDARGYATRPLFLNVWHDDPNDLVGRYRQAAITHGAELIVRVPCDNPCIDPDAIDRAVAHYLQYPSIYYSNTTDFCQGVAIDGIGVEVFSANRLCWLDYRTRGHALWREHPHKFFENAGILSLPPADIRLDVNTLADYDFIHSLYSHFGHNQFSTEDVLCALRTLGYR